ncbi:MAG: DUF2231 domain-containing protein [Pseudomonadota bacterium]
MEIIPNWHPIFVHFTVALLITSVGFYLLARFDFSEARQPRWSTLANWNLWAGAAITVLTVAAGIYAFYTVDHDTPSHEAMIEHRNWAIPTFLYFFAMATWAWRMARSGRSVSTPFIAALLFGSLLLLSTAWHGSELVYRHGLGVISLPKVEGEGHAHQHDAGDGAGRTAAPAPMNPADEPRSGANGLEHGHAEDAAGDNQTPGPAPAH